MSGDKGSSILYEALGGSTTLVNPYLELLVQPIFENTTCDIYKDEDDMSASHETWKYCDQFASGGENNPEWCDDGQQSGSTSDLKDLKDRDYDDMIKEYYNFHKRHPDNLQSYWIKFRDGEGGMCSAQTATDECIQKAESMCEKAFTMTNPNTNIVRPMSNETIAGLVVMVSWEATG